MGKSKYASKVRRYHKKIKAIANAIMIIIAIFETQRILREKYN